MLWDVELFKSRISKLDGAADLGDYLVNLISDKTIAQKEEPLNPTNGLASTEATERPEVSSRTNLQGNSASIEKS
jgi:hypothetical protein